MNNLYKTIFNKRTGQIIVVSENTSSNYQSQNGSSKNPRKDKNIEVETTLLKLTKKKSMTKLIAPLIFLLSMPVSIAWSATCTQDANGNYIGS